jgi:CPA2 family monovalent cation:H+ antiporter-2
VNLRGLTGATAIAIHRTAGEVLIPTGKEELQVGDVLALAGTHDAVEAASRLLTGAQTPVPSLGDDEGRS